MIQTKRIWMGTIAMAALALPSPPSAQATGHATVGITHEQWSWNDQTLSELSTRLRLSIAPSAALRLEAMTGMGSFDSESGDQGDIEGATDLKVRGSYQVGDHFLLRAGFNGPTGATEFETGESVALRAVANRFLGLQTNRFGEGSGYSVGAAFSLPIGGAAVGFGGGYQAKGPYTPYRDSAEYDPGDQLSGTVGIEFGDPSWKWRTNATVIVYDEDQYDSEAIFQNATRAQIRSLFLRRFVPPSGGHSTSLWAVIQYISFATEKEQVDSTLVAVDDSRFGDELYATAGITRFLGRSQVRGSLGLRLFTGNDLDEAEGRRIDLGLGGRVSLGPVLSLDGSASYSLGTIDKPFYGLDAPAGSTPRGFRAALRTIVEF